ncbi:hypothetical protein GOBAR_AA40145 [Gossypium barbadense]|uniref:Uncharacterized protein n=1 Tax=Gossypium barbadense TaxID=3634 RepID=A0A2P5VP15_GOSBA|nr:hypothetical protein GOBAR_AA40145 [Gossypium barbadense]
MMDSRHSQSVQQRSCADCISLSESSIDGHRINGSERAPFCALVSVDIMKVFSGWKWIERDYCTGNEKDFALWYRVRQAWICLSVCPIADVGDLVGRLS